MTQAFSALPLSSDTLTNLNQLGYTEMTAIQAASLPLALAGGAPRTVTSTVNTGA